MGIVVFKIYTVCISALENVFRYKLEEKSMLGKHKKGGWIGVGVGVGTAIAVATKEPTWIAVGIAFGAAAIPVFNLKFFKNEKNKE